MRTGRAHAKTMSTGPVVVVVVVAVAAVVAVGVIDEDGRAAR